MKTEILKMLRQTDEYLSGQQICDTFQVSRTAVWKAINQLKEEGYEIEAVRNRGYRLASWPDVLSEKEIASCLKSAWAGRNLEFWKDIDSTNTRAKELGEKGAPHGTLVVAEQQTAGKGRRGRSWVSPAGSSIYMTLLLRPEVEPSRAPMLTLLMAYSIAEALRESEQIDVQIKWPNDLVLNKKKICGILTEMSAEVDYVHYVVIGVGINVNTEEFPEEIARMATSLRVKLGREFRRAEIISSIMQKFENYYEAFCKDGNLSCIVDGYNRILVNKDSEVRVLEPGNEYNAKALGIDDTGELIVEKEDKSRTRIFSGEVSVRGIYGYV